MASSPAIVVCTTCHMYSLSLSVGDEGFTCDKCIAFEMHRIKETRIQALVEDSKNVRAVDTALDATSSRTPVHCSVPVEPVQQGNWVTVRRHSRGSKHRSSVPIRISNRFSPLSDAPTEKPGESALVIGDSIDSFQSRDRLEDLEGKTSIELLHKRVNFSSVSQPQIFRSPLKRIKQVFLNKMQVLAICKPY